MVDLDLTKAGYENILTFVTVVIIAGRANQHFETEVGNGQKVSFCNTAALCSYAQCHYLVFTLTASIFTSIDYLHITQRLFVKGS